MSNRTRSLAVLLAMGFTVAAVSCAQPRYLSQQFDPGNLGVGVEGQKEPYVAPPEAVGPIKDAPKGMLTDPAPFYSKLYKLRFRYRLYVPEQYKKGMPAALMVFQDGNTVYVDGMKAPQVMDNLIHAGDIPIMIGLFIEPGTVSGDYNAAADQHLRSAQYDTLDDKYSRFLLNEIIPGVVTKKYRLVTDANGWAVAGHGSGGIAALTVAWQRPDRFRKVLTQNGSFVNIRGGGDYPNLVRGEPVKPLRVYLLSGTNDLKNASGNWFVANKNMAMALADKKYEFRYMQGTGAQSPPTQAQADFPDALRWIWRGYTIDPLAKK